MPETENKQKIAILGGGMAGLTAAFELTSVAGWEERFEITIYQMGWRLGGKCATGRGPNGRIEEHGIHAFSGSYYNALGLMWDCYGALPGAASSGVFSSFAEAFRPGNCVLMWEVRNGNLVTWPLYFAPNALSPERYRASMSEIEKIIHSASKVLETSYEAHARRQARRAGHASPEAGIWLFASAASLFRRLIGLLGLMRLLAKAGMLSSLGRTLAIWFSGSGSSGTLLDKFRRLKIFLNYLFTLRKGIFDPKYNLLKDGFDAIDDIEFDKWLEQNGAWRETLESPLAYNTVDLSYNYPKGDTSQRPRMGAGTYLHWTLRMFLNLGPFAWSFEAGTGETVIAPLYHVLKKRGVRFEFFHKVSALRLSEDKSNVRSVEFEVQAELKDAARGYDPLVWVKDLKCWPNRPKYPELVQGEALKAQDIDLESYWSPWKAPTTKTLTADVDYDKLVFAISIGAVPYLCADLLEQSEAWRNMVDHVVTCPTQTMQIWLTEESKNLGAGMSVSGETNEPTISGTFVDPFNGQVDFSHLIPYEDWGSEPPKSLWYFSGSMAQFEWPDFSRHDFPNKQHDRVKFQSIQFLQATAGYLLPWATKNWDPLGLDFSLLRSTNKDAVGVERFDSQFWRANIDPTERYVMSPEGSTKHRLAADGSGFSNLILAGDWIYNGLNVGSVEGAVIGGKLAARAISGSPAINTIYGYPSHKAS